MSFPLVAVSLLVSEWPAALLVFALPYSLMFASAADLTLPFSTVGSLVFLAMGMLPISGGGVSSLPSDVS